MFKKKSFNYFFLIFLFFINFFIWIEFYELKQPQNFEVVFFDVGQGDAVLVKTNFNHYILIDGGENSLILEKLKKEIPFWTKNIDLVILTHAHADHLGGLIDVIENYNVKNILWNGVSGNSNLSKKWEDIISGNDYNIKISQLGQRIQIKEFVMDVLYPFNDISGEKFKDLNLSSIVLKINYLDNVFLLMGDADKSIEKELVEMMERCGKEEKEIKCRGLKNINSNVLKIGHHGSKTSTSEYFLEKVSPSIGIISVGENNKYNHPHKETLELLEKYDIKIARTDKDGDIKIIINN